MALSPSLLCYVSLVQRSRHRGNFLALSGALRRGFARGLLLAIVCRTFTVPRSGTEIGGIAPAQAAGQDEVTRRPFGIGGFKVPPRWQLRPQDQPSYPQLLAWASRGQGAEQAIMTLVARRLTPGTTVLAFAGDSARLREVPGLTGIRLQTQTLDETEVRRGEAGASFGGRRVVLDGVLDGGRRVVRQIYLVNGEFGYVLTLVAPQTQAVARLRDLEDTAAGLYPMAPENRATPGATPPPAAAPIPEARPVPTPAPVPTEPGPR